MNFSSINWSALEHAYGSADGIPAILEQIKNNKADSVDSLSNLIAHQGWMTYEVAVEVVPFLCEMLPELSGKTKALTIVLLADLLCYGMHEHFIPERMKNSGMMSEMLLTPEMDEMRKRILPYSETILSYINDRSHLVRKAVAVFATISEADISIIENRLKKEKQETTKADLLISIGWRYADLGEEASEILHKSLSDKSPIVQSGAALGLSYLLPLEEIGFEHFLPVLESEKGNGCMWNRGDFQSFAISLIINNCKRYQDFSPLHDLLDKVPRKPQASIISTIINNNFSEIIKNEQKGVKAEELNDQQRLALELALKYETFLPHAFGTLKLPETPLAIRWYLGTEQPKDLLDRTVTYKAEQKVVRELVQEICIKNIYEDVIELSEFLAEVYSDEECPKVAELIYQTNRITEQNGELTEIHVDSLWLSMLFLIKKVKTAFSFIKQALFAYKFQEPMWWGVKSQYIGTAYVQMVWAVLYHHNPDIEVFKFLERGSVDSARHSFKKIPYPDLKKYMDASFERLVELKWNFGSTTADWLGVKKNRMERDLSIESIPWERILSFKGRSTDFPHLFKSADSQDEKIQDKALANLSNAILHQDSIIHATPLVLYFLFILQKNKPTLKEKVAEIYDMAEEALQYQITLGSRTNSSIFLENLFLEDALLPQWEKENDDQLIWEKQDTPEHQTAWLSATDFIIAFYKKYKNHSYKYAGRTPLTDAGELPNKVRNDIKKWLITHFVQKHGCKLNELENGGFSIPNAEECLGADDRSFGIYNITDDSNKLRFIAVRYDYLSQGIMYDLKAEKQIARINKMDIIDFKDDHKLICTFYHLLPINLFFDFD